MIDTSKQTRTVTDGSNHPQRQVHDSRQGQRSDYQRNQHHQEEDDFEVKSFKPKNNKFQGEYNNSGRQD